MIISVDEERIKRKCDTCGEIVDEPIKARPYIFLEEFSEYENYSTDPCEKCGSIEFLNMNIPTDEMEEFELEREIMPFSDINQRFYLRKLIRKVRQDFIDNEGKDK